jgi:ATP-dependent Clp protease ATP-binding subunit ClpX
LETILPEVACSFCFRSRNEVKALLEGGGKAAVFICDRCMDDGLKVIKKSAALTKDGHKRQKIVLQKPTAIKAFLDDHVIGQEKAKVDLSIAVYNHYRRREAILEGVNLGDVEIQKSNILLMGPSGVGKTELARTIAKLLNVPFCVGDATRLTQAGYVGDDVESLIQGLLMDARGDIELAQWGICFIDEFDKLARKSGRSGSGVRDVGGEGVQQSILKMLEGTVISIPRGPGARAGMMSVSDEVDTSNILFICAGSFAGIEEVIGARINNRAHVGFGSVDRQKLDKTSTYMAVTDEDILEFGLIPELLGRLPVVTTCIDLTEAEMIRIITVPKNAILKQFTALFKLDGIDLQFDDEALVAIAREAKKRPTGARALRAIIESALSSCSFHTRSQLGVASIRITVGVIENTGAPEVKLHA